MTQNYDPAAIEARWQAHWERQGTYRTPNPGEPGFDPAAPKYYVLDMFPYPSGAGLHVGHPTGYIGSDIVARRKRMQGFSVLHPMGFDAFGLPAEQYAIQTGKHPAETTAENIANYRRQLRLIGFSYDWSREVNTSDPSYYRWTQWIFARLFERGLAYQAEVPVWWCEALKTVLSNEEVIDGRSERGDHPCERRPLKQWMLRITAYADRLIDDLDELDWPESVKTMQREWIGRSEGAEIRFPIQGHADELTVYTTRPDTLYGATFMVISPEHPLLERITTPEQRDAVDAYRRQASTKSELARTDLAKTKTGVHTGAFALNPLLDPKDPAAKLAILVGDYVLMSYGTGAIMCVPAHDERDFEFAEVFDLPVRPVVQVGDEAPDASRCVSGDGVAVHSPLWDGLPTAQAKARALEVLEQRGIGTKRVQYRLRDWLFSRQRYWGEPFPLLHLEDGSIRAVPDADLPVELPAMANFEPSSDGTAPLAKAVDWVNTVDPVTGRPARRDTDTMPGWAGSCWYYLRFMDPANASEPFSGEAAKYWQNVDLYVGGTEHAVLHLLYARFWHKVLYDLGRVPTKEPFQKLFNQGMLTAFAYKDPTGRLVPSDEVEEVDGSYRSRVSGAALEQVIAKMSKSLRNVVNPDDVCAEYGADTFRLYEMFMGPLSDSKPWNPRDVPGCRRFLDRLWRLFVDPDSHEAIRPHLLVAAPAARTGDNLELEYNLNQCLAKVEHSFERFNFNTAVAGFMAWLNAAGRSPEALDKGQAERIVCALAPFAPHIAEELWERLGHGTSVTVAPWPAVDPNFLERNEVEVVVQVGGKLRAKVMAPRGAGRDQLEELARAAAADALAGRDMLKVVVVPDKLVNFVVR
ncbi:MAG: leucine--tRNA ligase [Planctomycetaceae bacterium]|nr:leucine--tRNA ligase [Planctomycetaceae bacterium]